MSLPDNETGTIESLYEPCDYCPDITNTASICPSCQRRFCDKHASTVDPLKCLQCLPFGEGHIEHITEFVSPLFDQNNHPHRGRRIVPTGEGYKTLPRAISEMSEEELEIFIETTALRVHEVERQRDYLKVSLSTAKLEQDERKKEEIASLRSYRSPSRGIKITGTSDKNGGKIKGVAGGINIQDFLKFAGPALAKMRAGGSVHAGPLTPPPSPSSTGSAASLGPAKMVAPSSVGASVAPGPLGEGPVTAFAATKVVEKMSDELIRMRARDAEIEAILAGGEPQTLEMKSLLTPIKGVTDDDIPF